jgi:hypothetical protein
MAMISMLGTTATGPGAAGRGSMTDDSPLRTGNPYLPVANDGFWARYES